MRFPIKLDKCNQTVKENKNYTGNIIYFFLQIKAKW